MVNANPIADPIPATMRAAVAYSFDDIRVETVPVPVPGPGEALLKITAASICTGDVTPWYINQKAAKSGGSVTLGHEAAGIIVALGEGAPERFHIGDRVVPHHHAPCLRADCRFCARKAYVQCPGWKATGFVPGGMAEYMAVSAQCLANDTQHIPDGVTDEDAALVEPAACSVKAVSKMCGLQRGGSLLIVGMGVMGMFDLLAARDLGAGTIIAADLIDWRLNRAREFGADVVIHSGREDLVSAVKAATGGLGAESVIVGPGVPAVIRAAIQAAAPGGTVCCFMTTPKGTEMPIEPFDLYFREVSFTQSYSCGPDDMALSLELIRRGVITAEKVITHRAPLADFPAAFRAASVPGENLKTMIRF